MAPPPISSGSAIRAAFIALRRNPKVVLAEISWRWALGAAAIALCTASLLIYFNTLTVTPVELLALRSHTPWLIADAIIHILQGSGPRLLRIAVIMTPALGAAWVAAASAGRAATLARLSPGPVSVNFRSLVLLHCLRAAFFIVSLVAYIGAAILAERISGSDSEPNAGIYLLLFLGFVTIITFARTRVNSLASLATFFAVLYGDSFSRGFRRSALLFLRRPRQITTINTLFGAVHFLLFAG